jgi:hypothetical protein
VPSFQDGSGSTAWAAVAKALARINVTEMTLDRRVVLIVKYPPFVQLWMLRPPAIR